VNAHGHAHTKTVPREMKKTGHGFVERKQPTPRKSSYSGDSSVMYSFMIANCNLPSVSLFPRMRKRQIILFLWFRESSIIALLCILHSYQLSEVLIRGDETRVVVNFNLNEPLTNEDCFGETTLISRISQHNNISLTYIRR
jgi:hypothetical protein